jgi:hypothetical protein
MIKLILISLMVFVGCGSEEPRYIQQPGGGVQAPNGGGGGGQQGPGTTSFREARQIMGQYCESCHANSPWLQDGTSLKNSSVKARTENRSMPPQSSSVNMPQAARTKLINFF